MNRSTALAVLAFAFTILATSNIASADEDLTNRMPRVERGQMVDPAPSPPPPSYPRIERDSSTNEPRLRVNPDVSLGGSVETAPDGGTSASGNVRFPNPLSE